MNPYIPEGRAEYVKIDEEYTYSFDQGRVGLLKNGHWTSLNNGKAWIAAANEIEELRATVQSLTQQIEADSDVIYLLRQDVERLEDRLSEATLW